MTSKQSFTKRSYEDGCAAAHALDLIGERWALLIVRELMLGPKRFTDLRTSLPGISANVLTQRLTELEQASVLQKRKLGPPVGTWVYDLTPWGKELEPSIIELGRWAVKSPCFAPLHQLSPTSLMLSFRAMFNPDRAEGLAAEYEIRLGDEHFVVSIRDGAVFLTRGNSPNAELIVESDPGTLAAVVYGQLGYRHAMEAEQLRLEGCRAAFERFQSLFSLPGQ